MWSHLDSFSPDLRVFRDRISTYDQLARALQLLTYQSPRRSLFLNSTFELEHNSMTLVRHVHFLASNLPPIYDQSYVSLTDVHHGG